MHTPTRCEIPMITSVGLEREEKGVGQARTEVEVREEEQEACEC